MNESGSVHYGVVLYIMLVSRSVHRASISRFTAYGIALRCSMFHRRTLSVTNNPVDDVVKKPFESGPSGCHPGATKVRLKSLGLERGGG